MNINAEFIAGKQGALFRLMRTPECVQGHILYLPPLFEQANQTRHMLTRSAINAYQQGFESIIVDHYGTSDSAGQLTEACLSLWQQDVIAQLSEIKTRSKQTTILSVSLSAALLLNNDILALIDGLILVQPEFNGKRFVQQFKRLALAAELDKQFAVEPSLDEEQINIAGYVMGKELLVHLSQQTSQQLTSRKLPCCWLEWQAADSELSTARANQYQAFQNALIANNEDCCYYAVDDVKFWQSTELEIAEQYLADEQQALLALFKRTMGAKTC